VHAEPSMSRDDLNQLLNGAVEVAADQLQESSEFAPFALAMQTEDGEILHLEPDEDDGQEPEQVRAMLVAGLRGGAMQGQYRAVAVVTDVTLEDDQGEPVSSAIHIALEHADEEPVTCIVPYEIGEEDLELADLVAEPGERLVFEEVVEN
jgi:hypothetical protein